jgi:hypothetical protein
MILLVLIFLVCFLGACMGSLVTTSLGDACKCCITTCAACGTENLMDRQAVAPRCGQCRQPLEKTS